MSGTGDGPAVAPTQGSGLPRPAPTSSDSGGAMAKSSTLLRDRGNYEELAQIGNGKGDKKVFCYRFSQYELCLHHASPHRFGWPKQTCICVGLRCGPRKVRVVMVFKPPPPQTRSLSLPSEYYTVYYSPVLPIGLASSAMSY